MQIVFQATSAEWRTHSSNKVLMETTSAQGPKPALGFQRLKLSPVAKTKLSSSDRPPTFERIRIRRNENNSSKVTQPELYYHQLEHNTF